MHYLRNIEIKIKTKIKQTKATENLIITMLPMRIFAERSKQPLENMTNTEHFNKRKRRRFGHTARSSGLAKRVQ